jgi:D-3-phosphoglycerate dehydrogenase / 2-oxoglutarate reductase
MGRQVIVTAAVAQHQMARLRPLTDAGLDVVERFDLDDAGDQAALLAGLEGAWATIAGSEIYSGTLLQQLPDLAAIARWGSGYDRIDVRTATDQGIAVLTAPGANADPVADCAVMLMLACVRQLRAVDASVRSGAWRQPELTGDLTGATVGVVGLGAIGRAVVRRLRGFDCRVLGSDPAADPADCRQAGIELLDLPEVLSQADIVTLHAPRTSATHGLIGARELASMPSGAIIINTSRGELVDEDALVAALERGHLGGAGLDVFVHEPMSPNHRLTLLDNVVLSGHAASFTALAARRTADAVVDALLKLTRGTLAAGCINPEVRGTSNVPSPRLPASRTRALISPTPWQPENL